MDLCEFDSCTNYKRANGYCAGHNKQFKDGRPLVVLATYGTNKGKVCIGPECERPAESRGMCGSHKSQHRRGAPLTVLGTQRPGPASMYDGVTCHSEGCERPAWALRLCRSHYAQVQRGGPVRPLGWRETPVVTNCRATDCKASATRVGFCDRHYRQARRRGIVGPAGVPCSADDCERPGLTRGLCSSHYRVALNEGKTCQVEACGKPVFGRDWCQTHYSRFQRHGDPLAWKKPTRQTCEVEGCDLQRVGQGLCDIHYRRHKRYGSTDVPAKPAAVQPPPFTCRQCGAELPKLKHGRRTYCSDPCREAWEYWDRRAKHRGRWLKRYGMTEGDFDSMLESQGGACAICRTKEPGGRNWCVDHCHDSGKVRGILCLECNAGLGKFKDNPDFLRRAIEYLAVAVP